MVQLAESEWDNAPSGDIASEMHFQLKKLKFLLHQFIIGLEAATNHDMRVKNIEFFLRQITEPGEKPWHDFKTFASKCFFPVDGFVENFRVSHSIRAGRAILNKWDQTKAKAWPIIDKIDQLGSMATQDISGY